MTCLVHYRTVWFVVVVLCCGSAEVCSGIDRGSLFLGDFVESLICSIFIFNKLIILYICALTYEMSSTLFFCR